MSQPIRVTVWHEHRHEHADPRVSAIYPHGIHAALKAGLEKMLGDRVIVTTATLDQDDHHGLSDPLLAETDVMTWWGHMAHDQVRDDIAHKVAQRVREGMGLIVLHSAHYAKPFKLLMGTNCHLKWREVGERERLWCLAPGHPITAGMTRNYIELDHAEMYGEPFDIPEPDELVFVSWFAGGEVFRSGCVWRRGAGRVFYFRPGHETYPVYHNDEILRVLANAVRYLAPVEGALGYLDDSPNVGDPLSPIA